MHGRKADHARNIYCRFIGPRILFCFRREYSMNKITGYGLKMCTYILRYAGLGQNYLSAKRYDTVQYTITDTLPDAVHG